MPYDSIASNNSAINFKHGYSANSFNADLNLNADRDYIKEPERLSEIYKKHNNLMHEDYIEVDAYVLNTGVSEGYPDNYMIISIIPVNNAGDHFDEISYPALSDAINLDDTSDGYNHFLQPLIKTYLMNPLVNYGSPARGKRGSEREGTPDESPQNTSYAVPLINDDSPVFAYNTIPENSIELESSVLPGSISVVKTRPAESPDRRLKSTIAIQYSVHEETDLEYVYRRQFDFYMNRGLQYMQQKMYFLAANSFTSASLYQPDHPGPYLYRAIALLGAEQFMGAAFYLDKAIGMDPKMTREPVDLSRVYSDPEIFQAQMAKLDDWYRQTNKPMLLFLKGYIFYHTGRLEQAHQLLRTSLRLQPEVQSVNTLLETINDALK